MIYHTRVQVGSIIYLYIRVYINGVCGCFVLWIFGTAHISVDDWLMLEV